MRVACGLSLLTSTTALCYQVVLGHRSCVARVNPAMARLGKPTASWRADGPYAVGPDVGNGDPDLLQELDAIEPTLSYQGWQKDVAEIEESYIQARGGTSSTGRDAFFKLSGKQERHDQVLRWLRELDELKATLSYEGWQEDVAEIEEWHLNFPEQFGKAEQLAKMRRKQQVHDRRLTRPGWPVPPDEIEDEIQPL